MERSHGEVIVRHRYRLLDRRPACDGQMAVQNGRRCSRQVVTSTFSDEGHWHTATTSVPSKNAVSQEPRGRLLLPRLPNWCELSVSLV